MYLLTSKTTTLSALWLQTGTSDLDISQQGIRIRATMMGMDPLKPGLA